MVLRIGHRGAAGYALENSLQSFKKAQQLNIDAVEFDVWLTKDKKVVVMHDDDVSKTSTGTGLVGDYTLTQLRKFRLDNGENIPTLKEVLDVLKCQAIVEIKQTGMEKEVLAVTKKYKNVVLISGIPGVVKKIKKLSPKSVTGLDIFSKFITAKKMVQMAKDVKADILLPNRYKASKKVVDLAHQNGMQIYVWTVDSPSRIAKMKKIGMDGIISNYPDRI